MLVLYNADDLCLLLAGSMSRALQNRRDARRLARLDKGWTVKDEQMGLDRFHLQDPYIAELLRRKQEKIREEVCLILIQ